MVEFGILNKSNGKLLGKGHYHRGFINNLKSNINLLRADICQKNDHLSTLTNRKQF